MIMDDDFWLVMANGWWLRILWWLWIVVDSWCRNHVCKATVILLVNPQNISVTNQLKTANSNPETEFYVCIYIYIWLYNIYIIHIKAFNGVAQLQWKLLLKVGLKPDSDPSGNMSFEFEHDITNSAGFISCRVACFCLMHLKSNFCLDSNFP